MKVLLCTTTFKNIANGPTKFADFLYRNGDGTSDLEVHILTEDTLQEAPRLYKCNVGILKKILPLAPIYRMAKYYHKSIELNKIHNFDYVIYNNAIFGIIHSLFRSNVVGMINDYNNQKNILKISFFNYAYVKKSLFKYFEKKAIQYSRLILANSNYLASELKLAYPKYASKIFRLYKGVEVHENLAKNNCNWNVEELKEIKILFIKNDFVTGGLEVLAKSLASIDLPFSVTIIGPPETYAKKIESYFENSNIEIVLAGRQSQQAIFDSMSTHHIFCVPSLQEALGVANLEALSVRIPVVSSNAGGIPEVLDNGRCGFLSSAGDVESLSIALKDCLHNKEERVKKVHNGFEYVKKFQSKFIFQNLKAILDDAV